MRLYDRSVRVSDEITIYVPTVGEVLPQEDEYNFTASLFMMTPPDLMVQLDDMGINFDEINEWQLFGMLFPMIQQRDTSLLFCNIDLKKLVPGENKTNGELVFFDPDSNLVIDRLIHYRIADTLRNLLFMKKNTRKPGNEEAREYMLYKERKRMKRLERKRQRGEEETSQLEQLIVALVNREEFKYDYETVKNLTVYQFYRSFHQIVHKVNYDNLMTGCYSGNIDTTKINKSELSWLETNQ